MIPDRIPATEVHRLRALRGAPRARWRDVIAEAALVFLVALVGTYALGVIYFEAAR